MQASFRDGWADDLGSQPVSYPTMIAWQLVELFGWVFNARDPDIRGLMLSNAESVVVSCKTFKNLGTRGARTGRPRLDRGDPVFHSATSPKVEIV